MYLTDYKRYIFILLGASKFAYTLFLFAASSNPDEQGDTRHECKRVGKGVNKLFVTGLYVCNKKDLNTHLQ